MRRAARIEEAQEHAGSRRREGDLAAGGARQAPVEGLVAQMPALSGSIVAPVSTETVSVPAVRAGWIRDPCQHAGRCALSSFPDPGRGRPALRPGFQIMERDARSIRVIGTAGQVEAFIGTKLDHVQAPRGNLLVAPARPCSCRRSSTCSAPRSSPSQAPSTCMTVRARCRWIG